MTPFPHPLIYLITCLRNSYLWSCVTTSPSTNPRSITQPAQIHKFIVIRCKIWRKRWPPFKQNITIWAYYPRVSTPKLCECDSTRMSHRFPSSQYGLQIAPLQPSAHVVLPLRAPQPDAFWLSDTLCNLREDPSIARYPRTETSIAYEAGINN